MVGRQSPTFEKYSANVYRLRTGTYKGLVQQIRTTSETETTTCVFHVVEIYG